MKKFTLALVTVLMASGCRSQAASFTPEYRKALRNGAKAKLTLKVTDEIGAPVTNATSSVYFDMINKRGNVVRGTTGTNGLFSAEALCADYVSIVVKKNGYYDTRFRYDDMRSSDPGRLKDGRWLPWNPTVPVVLREIRNPIPMYATWISEWRFPNDVDIGFDCEKGDFVAPHGKGELTDFVIRVSSKGIPFKDASSVLRLASPDKDGGFIRKQKFMISFFASEYEAPVDGYESEFRTSDVANRPFYERNPDDVSENEYLIFKSRIVRDEEGNIVSANYGKLYGRLEYGFAIDQNRNLSEPVGGNDYGRIKFSYYFNPTPNDHNLEFDLKKNLFDLKKRTALPTIQVP